MLLQEMICVAELKKLDQTIDETKQKLATLLLKREDYYADVYYRYFAVFPPQVPNYSEDTSYVKEDDLETLFDMEIGFTQEALESDRQGYYDKLLKLEEAPALKNTNMIETPDPKL
jgi:hypothetical protein